MSAAFHDLQVTEKYFLLYFVVKKKMTDKIFLMFVNQLKRDNKFFPQKFETQQDLEYIHTHGA